MNSIVLPCQALEKENQRLLAELSFGDLKEPTAEFIKRNKGAFTTISDNFDDHADFHFNVTQMTRSRALVILVEKDTCIPHKYVLNNGTKEREMTILDFIWAVFMHRTTDSVREKLQGTELFGLFEQLVRYTEGFEYDQECTVCLEDE